MQVQWNEKAERYLTAAQRSAFESGEDVRRLEGRLRVDGLGNVWFRGAHGDGERLLGVADAKQPEPEDKRDLAAPEASDDHTTPKHGLFRRKHKPDE